jgi:hypothetical protein
VPKQNGIILNMNIEVNTLVLALKNKFRLIFDTKKTFVLIVLILFLGSFLRIYQLGDIYSEIDDIGVISIYKDWNETQKQEKVLLNHPMVSVSYQVNPEYEKKHLLDSAFFPFQVAMSWTYPPGQYFLYPLFIHESDSFQLKQLKARAVTATLNILGLFLFLYLLYLINDKRLSINSLLPLCLVTFSSNAILYSHHMSPYASLITSFVLALILFYKTLTKKIGITVFFSLLGVITVFNYLIVLLVPVCGVTLVVQRKLFSPLQLFSAFWKGAIGYGVFFIPLMMFFLKPDRGMLGVLPESFSNGILTAFLHIIKQFFIAFSSVVASATSNNWINIALSVGIVSVSIWVFCKQRTKLGRNYYFFLSLYLFLLEWIVLYQTEKLVMDQTRHVLMWSVVAGLLLALSLLGRALNRKLIYVATILFIVLSLSTNLHHLQEKKSVFDYSAINAQNPELIISLDNWNASLFFEKAGMPVHVFSSPQTLDAYFQGKEMLPNKIILVSQETTFRAFEKRMPEKRLSILNSYDLKVLQEISTGTRFPYNDYHVSSNENGFYLYTLVKKNLDIHQKEAL